MSQTSLQRLSGVALLLGGILFALGNLMHPTTHSAEAHSATLWTEAHVTFMVGMMGILLGLPALYLRHAERTGWLGLIGFAGFFVGLVATIGGSWFEAFAVPELDEQAIHAVDHGIGVPFNLIFAMLFLLGQVALGAALYRTRAYPRAASLAVVLSAVILIPASGMTGEAAGVVIIASTAILGLALAFFGSQLARVGASSERAGAVVRVPSRSAV